MGDGIKDERDEELMAAQCKAISTHEDAGEQDSMTLMMTTQSGQPCSLSSRGTSGRDSDLKPT